MSGKGKLCPSKLIGTPQQTIYIPRGAIKGGGGGGQGRQVIS